MDTGVYAIKAPSGRMYIGSAANVRARWQHHMNALTRNGHHNAPLQAAFKKYGVLCYEVLELCSVENLLSREQFHIDAHVFENLYNIAETAGAPTRGKKFSAEHRAKMAEAARGRTHTAGTRARLSVAHKGKKKSAAHVAACVRGHLGLTRPDIAVGVSGYRGVYFCSSGGRWEAQVRINHKRVNVGRFATPVQAAAARLLFKAWRGPNVEVQL